MDQYYVSKIYKHIICSEVNDMFLWFPPPTKASWHNARESAESGGTIHLEINFSSKVYSKSLLKVGLLKGSPGVVPYI